MPPAKHLQRGLLPSIVDRLIDPESVGTAVLTGYSVAQMYDAVLRDLECLLNTVHTAQDIPPGYTELRESVLAYGLPDLASVEALRADQKRTIGQSIRKAVEQFEPRLRSVRVTLLKQDDETKMSLKFRIDARLAVDPAPDVAFDTILEVGTGKYLVREAAA
jgi:type VI secretion system protein ImpF